MIAISRAIRKAMTFFTAGCALAISACAPIGDTGVEATGPRINPARPVQVALLVPASDPEAGAVLAKSAENAARLAAADLDGVTIDLRVYDTGGDSVLAATAAATALADGAKIIVGPIFSQTTLAARSQLAASDINILSLSNNSAVAGGNVYLLGNTFENTARRMIAFAERQGRSRVFVIHAEDLAEQQGRDAIMAAIDGSNVSLAGVGSFELSQEGVTDAIPELGRQINVSLADTVFLTSSTLGALPYLADLLPDFAETPEGTQLIGLQRLDIPASALTVRGLQGSWFALPDTQLETQFRDRYFAAYGDEPHPIVAAPAYDAIAAIGALVATGDRAALTNVSLTRPQGFIGAGGVFRLRPDGTNDRALAVAQVLDNKVEVIDPAPRSFPGAGL